MKRKRMLAVLMAVTMTATLTMGMPMTGYAMDQGTETVANEPEAGTSSNTAATNPEQDAESVMASTAEESAAVSGSQETKPDVTSVAENKEAQNNTVGAAETKTSGNFEYKVKDDGTVSVTKYTGSDANVTIPKTIDGKKVTSIGEYAFDACTSLQQITIPDSVTSIGKVAFGSCSSLQQITIPDSVTSIGNYTFCGCTSLQQITIPDSVTSIGWWTFDDCTSLKEIYFYGDALTDVSFAHIPSDTTIYVLKGKSGWTVPTWNGYKTAYFTPESKPASTPTPVPTATPTPVPSQKVSSLPAGYNFLNDSYNFGNFDANISKKYFTTLFGSDKGNLLHKKYHKADGVCFGMAYTTAAIYNDYPNINTIVTRTGPFSSTICSKIRDINHTYIDPINYSGMYIGNHPITIEDYIKYACIYQFSKKVSDSSIWYNNDTQFEAYRLLQLVKNTTDNNKINVTIGMINHNTGEGHQVLAVGYDGNDILVDDPNYTKSLQRITVNNDGTWSFSGLNNWNSNTCYIRSNVDVQSPYLLLKSGQTTSSQEISSDSTKHTENYVEGMNIVDPDCNLVSISTDKFESDAKLTQVTNAEAIADHTSDGSNLYWTDNNVDKLTLSDLPNDNVEVEMAGNGSIISASAEKPDKIKLDTGNKLIALDTDQGSSCSISFKTCTESKDYKDTEVEVTVTGTSSSNNINVTQNDKGLAVSGIGEGTVTSSVDDKVIKSIEYNDNDGKITIAYDNTGDSDSLEVKADNTVTKKENSGKSQESRSMYRLYNPNSGEHFYTSNQGERDHLVSLGWRYEGVAWNAPLTGAPIFRLYNPNAGDHHYTGSEKERDDLVKLGWKYEGVAWYTAPSTTKKPQYRLYNPNCTGAGAHHYTGSIEERDGLVKLGWRYEGISWYGV